MEEKGIMTTIYPAGRNSELDLTGHPFFFVCLVGTVKRPCFCELERLDL